MMEDDEKAVETPAQRLSRLLAGMSHAGASGDVMDAPTGALTSIHMRSSTSNVDPNPISISLPLSSPNATLADICMSLSNVEDDDNILPQRILSERGISAQLWQQRVLPPVSGEVVPVHNSPYLKRIFGEPKPDTDYSSVLFDSPPVKSIDSITWAILLARCSEHAPTNVRMRLKEVAFLLSGEQWYDVWTGESSKATIAMVVFGTELNAWYIPSIVKAAYPMQLQEDILREGGARMACHLLSACHRGEVRSQPHYFFEVSQTQ